MKTAVLIGLILSGAALWYKGLYTGPWDQVAYTVALVMGVTILAFFALRILAGAAGFIFKLLVIAAILFACYYGGKKALVTVEKENNQVQAPIAK